MAIEGYSGANRGRIDRVRDVLSDPRRRLVLQELADHPTENIDFETLVGRMCESNPTTRTQLASDLHHIHLPKLADLGVITYDTERRYITHRTCRVADVLALAGEALEVGR